jgi:hypothetical protein
MLSCKNNNEEIIQYNTDGTILSKNYVREGKFVDSIIYYNKEKIDYKLYFKNNDNSSWYAKYYDVKGKIEFEGSITNKIKDGKWKYYDSNGHVHKVIEYKNICGKEYENQIWKYDENNKIVLDSSFFITYSLKDPIFKAKKDNVLTIKYTPNLKGARAIPLIYFSPDLDSTFCNVNQLKLQGLKSPNNDYIFIVNIGFENKGKQKFMGYIEEHSLLKTNKKDSLDHFVRNMYIDIPLEVE